MFSSEESSTSSGLSEEILEKSIVIVDDKDDQFDGSDLKNDQVDESYAMLPDIEQWYPTFQPVFEEKLLTA